MARYNERIGDVDVGITVCRVLLRCEVAVLCISGKVALLNYTRHGACRAESAARCGDLSAEQIARSSHQTTKRCSVIDLAGGRP